MKENTYVKIAFISGYLLLLGACHSDSKSSISESSSDNEWIEEEMRDLYYWYNEIPEKSKLNYALSPEDFFTSLLSQKDGKNDNNSEHYFYSYLEKITDSRSYMGKKPSLGFEFQLWNITDQNIFAISVLYTLPNSPASRAGLKRGDWIIEIDNEAVNQSNVNKLIDRYSVKLGLSESTEKPINKYITLEPEMIVDNPVFLDTVFDMTAYNRKVGYLVYNHFTSGPGGENDETFNNILRKTFSRFKTENITDFILDLRYNLGGIVTSSQLLSTMLAPASALDKVFCHLVYNDKNTSLNSTLNLDTRYMKQGANGENLNLNRLFIITSNKTASASEALINGLSPYMNDGIILIGQKTDGKNVGSITITNPSHNYELHPIVCQLYNKNNESNYVNGFEPVVKIREDGMDMEELGSLNEFLLNITMQYVLFGGPASHNNSKSVLNTKNILIYNSLDRNKLTGTIIPQNSDNLNDE